MQLLSITSVELLLRSLQNVQCYAKILVTYILTYFLLSVPNAAGQSQYVQLIMISFIHHTVAAL